MIAFFTILMVAGNLTAQEENTLQNWFDYTQNNKINGKWAYLGDYVFRFQIIDEHTKWGLIHVRPSVILITGPCSISEEESCLGILLTQKAVIRGRDLN